MVASAEVAGVASAAGNDVSSDSYSSSDATHDEPKKDRPVEERDLSVVVLTSRNFDASVRDGVWLVEFYAPWCSHCRHFESTYAEIAAHFHAASSAEKKKIQVAKVNGDAEKALSTRFGIRGYPSFYVVDGWSVYLFESARSKHNLIKFVEQDYKNSDPIPFYASPMGPLGLSQGLLMVASLKVADLFEWLQDTFGLSPLFAGTLLFGLTFLGCFCAIVLLVIFATPKVKSD
jgi:thiol-disulfide isomerase/thioredoxin